MTSAEKIIVPYGTPALPSIYRHRDGTTEALPAAGAPCAIIEPARHGTLRMADVAPLFNPAPTAQDLAHAEAQLAFLESHVLVLCGDWNRNAVRFVTAYFEAIRRHLDRNADRVAELSDGLVGLVEPLHYAFSAPMPLPRAYLPDEAGQPMTEAAEIAFWCDGRFHVCRLGGSSLRKSEREHLERLRNLNVAVIELSGEALDPAGLLDRLGPSFSGFLDRVRLPASPFRPRPLGRPVGAAVG